VANTATGTRRVRSGRLDPASPGNGGRDARRAEERSRRSATELGSDGRVLPAGFSGARQRPAVEAALGALEQVEWRRLDSELEAALEELRLLRELRPPANARGPRPDRYVYLARRGER
jgi:hypothetical protein